MPDPENVDVHELSVQRVIDAPIDAVWQAFTEHLDEWWCPRPWRTEIVEQDWRPGGRSALVLRGPDGEEHRLEGVVLEVVRERRVVSTNAFDVRWRPRTADVANLICLFTFEPEGNKTRYKAAARHWDAESAAQHDAMGFTAGWGVAADQLAELAMRLRQPVQE